jgi:hypothetical protein
MVAHDGMQSHCGTLASNTRKFPIADVLTSLLLAGRTFCTGCCARFVGDETCHSRYVHSIPVQVGSDWIATNDVNIFVVEFDFLES